MPGVSFVGVLEIETFSVTPLTGDGDLGVRASIEDIEAHGSSVSLEDVGRSGPRHPSQMSAGSASRHLS